MQESPNQTKKNQSVFRFRGFHQCFEGLLILSILSFIRLVSVLPNISLTSGKMKCVYIYQSFVLLIMVITLKGYMVLL